MIAAYLRCSSPKRLGRQDTASQRARLTTYAKAQGFRIGRFFEDYATGRNSKRPGLTELLTACRNGQVSTILATDLSRLSRSVKDAVDIVRELATHNVKLVVVNQGFTFEPSAINNAILQIMGVLAELESAIKSERVLAGLRLARERGVKLGARPNTAKRRTAQKLRLKGLSYQQIGTKLGCSLQNAAYLCRQAG